MTSAVLDPPTADPQHNLADQTAEDLLAVSKDSSHRYELIAGKLFILPLAAAEHGAIVVSLCASASLRLCVESLCL